MMLGARTAAWSGKALPYDAEVEYLESTGTQWINTGIIADENTRVKATLMTLSTGNNNWFGGQVMFISGNVGFVFDSYSVDKLEYIFGNSGWLIVDAPNLVGRIFTADFGKNGLVIDGNTVSIPSYKTFHKQSAPIAIFVRIGGSAYIKGRLYVLQIYQSGVLVRDFISVRVGDVGYLYDRVSGQLFGNSGTGAFIIGPDKTI